jgi:hypothetical protein
VFLEYTPQPHCRRAPAIGCDPLAVYSAAAVPTAKVMYRLVQAGCFVFETQKGQKNLFLSLFS